MNPNMTHTNAAIDQLSKLLEIGDEAQRCYSARAISEAKITTVNPQLNACLYHQDPDVVIDAATALATACSGDLDSLLDVAMNHPDSDARLAALSAIAKQYDNEKQRVVDTLTKFALGRGADDDWGLSGGWDDWWDLQLTAVQLLSAIQAEKRTDLFSNLFVKLLEQDPEPEPDPYAAADEAEASVTDQNLDAPVEFDPESQGQLIPEFHSETEAELEYEEDDDLIASLPDGFQLTSANEQVIEDDEPDLDLTRPVTELMRPTAKTAAEPQQEMMELLDQKLAEQELPIQERDEKNEPFFTLADEVSEQEASGKKSDEAELITPELYADPHDHYNEPVDDLVLSDVKPEKSSFSEPETESKSKPQSEETSAGIQGQSLQKIPEADKVLVISVVAPENDNSFSGRSLLQILLACGMRYGDMKIFHRYEDGLDQGAIQFSMTNAMEPGFFDIDTMDTLETRGVTFFMSMEEPRDVMNAYECMLATAEAVAKNLHGDLLDENRSTMRSQTKEHYRERIRRFEMRKLKQSTTA